MSGASQSTANGSPLLDDGLARRLKALACTGPLHDLDARKSRLEFAEAGVYQMAEIAFQVIDQVTVAMDFDRGANHDDTNGAGSTSNCSSSSPARTVRCTCAPQTKRSTC